VGSGGRIVRKRVLLRYNTQGNKGRFNLKHTIMKSEKYIKGRIKRLNYEIKVISDDLRERIRVISIDEMIKAKKEIDSHVSEIMTLSDVLN
jgi:hypothetical protein